VQDNRLPSKPVTFIYRYGSASIDKLVELTRKDTRNQSAPMNVPHWILVLPILVGIWVGLTSAKRMIHQVPQ
jgi:hypothetical protein